MSSADVLLWVWRAESEDCLDRKYKQSSMGPATNRLQNLYWQYSSSARGCIELQTYRGWILTMATVESSKIFPASSKCSRTSLRCSTSRFKHT
jgi:hypothetical protein